MTAVWALGCYIAAIIVWNAVLKRNIGEALIVGFLVTGLFAGGDIGHAMWAGFAEAMQEEVTFAALAFVFMSYLLARTPSSTSSWASSTPCSDGCAAAPCTPPPSPPGSSAPSPTSERR